MDHKKRMQLSWLGSLGVHAVLFLALAAAGVFHFTPPQDDIVEVAIFGGGGGGQPAAAPEQSAPAAAPPQPIEPDSILQHSDTAVNHTTYQDLQQPAPSPAAAAGGTGSGEGTGSGDGSGPGTGSGEGDESGSGYGSGDGISSSPAIPPRLVRSVQPSYPAAARNAGIEGTTVLRLLVGYEGDVEDVTVIASSGSSSLDAAAETACYSWRFTSARNGANQKIRCYIEVPINFQLRR